MTPSQWKSRWTQGRCPDEERLPLTEGLRCVAVQQRQLDYVKTDTRLYQQYLWLREGPEAKAAALELKLDLYHPDNVLMLGQQRVPDVVWFRLVDEYRPPAPAERDAAAADGLSA